MSKNIIFPQLRNNSVLENNKNNNPLILTHKFYFDEMWSSNILQENSVFSCCSELEPDVTRGGGVEGWELDGGIRLSERHHVVKHICNWSTCAWWKIKFIFYVLTIKTLEDDYFFVLQSGTPISFPKNHNTCEINFFYNLAGRQVIGMVKK